MLAIYGPALFALVSPVYLGVRVLLRWRHGVRSDFPMAVWMFSSAAPVVLVAVALTSILRPYEVSFILYFGLCFLGIAMSLVVNWLKPAGWTMGDLRTSIFASLSLLWSVFAVYAVGQSLGSGH